MAFFENSLSILIVFLTYRILLAPSSIEAVLLLILLAINFSMLLFFFGINFLAILYLAVYIGAVAVFFLFVVMMTDISGSFNKAFEGSDNYAKVNNVELMSSNKYKIIYLFCIVLLGFYVSNFFTIIFNFAEFGNVILNNKNMCKANDLTLDQFNVNIELLGFSIFNEYAGPFIISSILILIALIGSIFITKLVSESETQVTIPLTPVMQNVQITENNKSQEMEVQLVRHFLNSIYLNLNR